MKKCIITIDNLILSVSLAKSVSAKWGPSSTFAIWFSFFTHRSINLCSFLRWSSIVSSSSSWLILKIELIFTQQYMDPIILLNISVQRSCFMSNDKTYVENLHCKSKLTWLEMEATSSGNLFLVALEFNSISILVPPFEPLQILRKCQDSRLCEVSEVSLRGAWAFNNFPMQLWQAPTMCDIVRR